MASAASGLKTGHLSYASVIQRSFKFNSDSTSEEFFGAILQKLEGWYSPRNSEKVISLIQALTNIDTLQKNEPDTLIAQLSTIQALRQVCFPKKWNAFQVLVYNDPNCQELTFLYRIEKVTDHMDVDLPALKAISSNRTFFNVTLNYGQLDISQGNIPTADFVEQIGQFLVWAVGVNSAQESGSVIFEEMFYGFWKEAITEIQKLNDIYLKHQRVQEAYETVNTTVSVVNKRRWETASSKLPSTSDVTSDKTRSSLESEATTELVSYYFAMLNQLEFLNVSEVQSRMCVYLEIRNKGKYTFDKSDYLSPRKPVNTSTKMTLSLKCLNISSAPQQVQKNYLNFYESCIKFFESFLPKEGERYGISREYSKDWIDEVNKGKAEIKCSYMTAFRQ